MEEGAELRDRAAQRLHTLTDHLRDTAYPSRLPGGPLAHQAQASTSGAALAAGHRAKSSYDRCGCRCAVAYISSWLPFLHFCTEQVPIFYPYPNCPATSKAGADSWRPFCACDVGSRVSACQHYSLWRRIHGEVSRDSAIWSASDSLQGARLEEVLYSKAQADGIAKVSQAVGFVDVVLACCR